MNTPRTRQSVLRTYFADPALGDVIRFLNAVKNGGAPDDATVHITEERGDPSDPREASFRAVNVEIEWR